MRKGDILVCKYEDRKTLYSLTSKYTAGLVPKTKKYGGRTYYQLSKQLDHYNEFMGSVDKADQYLEPYSYSRKSLAWFKKIAIHFVDRLVLNNYLVYSNQQPAYNKELALYIKDVAEGLLSEFCPYAKAVLDKYYSK